MEDNTREIRPTDSSSGPDSGDSMRRTRVEGKARVAFALPVSADATARYKKAMRDGKKVFPEFFELLARIAIEIS